MRRFVRSTVYFASGTGNSFLVAAWFRDACAARGLQAGIFPTSRAEPARDIGPSSAELLALAFPTHGGLPPWSVIKFLLRLPRRRGVGFLCLPTRGSFYLGPVLVPGAAALASFLPSVLLLLKGFRPAGAVSLDMPVNVTSVHPALTSRHAARIVSRARRKFIRHMDRFFPAGSLWLTRNNLYEAVWSALILYFVPLFPLLYLLVGRFFMGKILFATARCIGCGTCARSCPAGALILKGARKPRPYWRYNCEHCLRCLNYCPERAIGASLPWAALLWWIGAAAAGGAAVFARLATFFPALESVRSYWAVELANSVIYYPVFLAAYFLFFHLTGWRPLNAVLSRTAPSFFLRQYRAPGASLGDLTGTVGKSRPS